MKSLRVLLPLLLVSFSHRAISQTFEVPTDYELKVAADYKKYEKDMIAAAKWLAATPLNEEAEKRQQVSAFVVQWVNGSPTVNVELNPTILNFEEKNKGMMVLFMACSAKYVLENNYSVDVRAKQKSALEEMIKVYQSGNGISKDKKMEKLIKASEAGKIDEWLEENFKMQK
jgi:hypothetical protein